MREFPELDWAGFAVFPKPLVAVGKVQTDAGGGAKRVKYFVGEQEQISAAGQTNPNPR